MKANLLFLLVVMFAGVSCTSVTPQASSFRSPPIILDADISVGGHAFKIASDPNESSPLIVFEQSVERGLDGVAHTVYQYVE